MGFTDIVNVIWAGEVRFYYNGYFIKGQEKNINNIQYLLWGWGWRKWLTLGRINGILPSIKIMAKHDKSYFYSHIVPAGIYQPLTDEQKFQIEYDLTIGKMAAMGIIKIDENNNISLVRDMTEEDRREMSEFKKELGLTN